MPDARQSLLVVWEGADWGLLSPLLDEGLLPNLERLVTEGVMGDLVSLQPQSQPLLDASLATGCRAFHHRVLGALTPDGDRVRTFTASDLARPPLWAVAHAAGLRCRVVGWPTYPADPRCDRFVSGHFGRLTTEGFVEAPRLTHPVALAAELADLRLRPEELGVEELSFFVPHPERVEQETDPSLALIASWVAEGASTHAAAMATLEGGDWGLAVVRYAALQRFTPAFMPFHPPRRSGVNERAFGLYRGVMTAVARYLDMQLGALLGAAGPEATVILASTHGLRSGADRPMGPSSGAGDAAWRRPLGLFAMRGPQVRKDELLWGASILDVAPTLLASLGVSPADPIDGSLLTAAFVTAPTTAAAPPATALGPSDLSEAENATALSCLLVDGVVTPEALQTDATAQAADALAYNEAVSLFEKRRLAEACDLLTDLCARRPESGRFALLLANCCEAAGDYERCEQALALAEAAGDVASWRIALIKARCEAHRGDLDAALDRLFDAHQSAPKAPGVNAQIGWHLLQRGDHAEARKAFEKELAVSGDAAVALEGLAEIAFHASDYQQAAERLLQVVDLSPYHPRAHRRLGQVFEKLGRADAALAAYQRAFAQGDRSEEVADALRKLRFAKE